MAYKDLKKLKVSRQKYNQSPKGKITRKKAKQKYDNSPKGREYKRKYNQKYFNSPEGKEYQINYNKKYYRSPKYKISYKKYVRSPKGAKTIVNCKLKRRCGINIDEYNKLLSIQRGICAICGNPPINKRLAVDHDHKCCPGGKSCGECIRELLCQKCNVILGLGNDSILFFKKVINYLEKHGGKNNVISS